jgi:biopolymer transport protein ExbD
MSEISTESGGKKKGGKPAPKKMSTRVDFTPMVDLGFLLITFFMLTTTLIKPQTMEISMPVKDKVKEEEQTKVKDSRAITIILGENNIVYYYFGAFKDGKDPEVITTNYSADGVRRMLLKRNIDVVMNVADLKKKKDNKEITEEEYKKLSSEAKAVKTAPVVIIKATDDASYKNLVDILDEMHICNLEYYAIVDITTYDLELIKKPNPNI